MYHFIIKQICRKAFDQLSRQNLDPLLAKCRPDMQHRFAGDHALGGVRHSRQAFRLWLKRLLTLFPDIHFTIKDMMVTGMPWHTRVAIVWSDQAYAADGVSYGNEGVHVLTLKWGKLQKLDARLDTQHLERALNRMAAAGIREAAAKPITYAES